MVLAGERSSRGIYHVGIVVGIISMGGHVAMDFAKAFPKYDRYLLLSSLFWLGGGTLERREMHTAVLTRRLGW